MGFFVRTFDQERKHRCDGKNIVITGANTGIGLETARELLARGGNVFILCRNEARMNAALEELKKTSENVEGLLLDLKSFDSVRNVSDQIHTKLDHIDTLILNAGIMKVPFELCEGLESQQCTNHFSHFLLLNNLYSLLKRAPSRPRVVSVSSNAHRSAQKEQLETTENYWKRFENKEDYDRQIGEDTLWSWKPYGASKLANILHMRHAATVDPDVSFFSLHPGVVSTELARHWQKESPIFFTLAGPFLKAFLKTSVEGAQTSLYCSLAPELEAPKYNGRYYSDIALADPKPRFAFDKEDVGEMAARLWKISEEITQSKMT